MNKFLLLLTLSLILISHSYSGELPEGWYLHKKFGNKSNVEAGTDDKIFYSSPNSFYLKSMTGGGNINQSLIGNRYAGKRIRISAYLKSDNLIKTKGYGGQVWAYSYINGKPYCMGASGNIEGTNNWKKYTVVLDVPSEGKNISLVYGLSVQGEGTVWIDNMTFEIVDKKTTPLLNANYSKNYKNIKPKNLP